MARPLSKDLRERIVGAVEGGMSRNAAAEVYGVAVSTAVKLMQQWASTHRLEAKPMGGCHGYKLDKYRDLVERLVAAKPDATLSELQEELKAHKVNVGRTSVFRFLNHLKLSFKKKTLYASEQDRPDIQKARDVWHRAQRRFDPKNLVFIDETGATTNMARLYGRCAAGERLIGKEPLGDYETVTFVGALRITGMTAPMILNCPMDGNAFRTYVTSCLAPTLNKGDIVVMDNLPVHKVSGIREAIEAVGAKLRYLPSYSPDMDPIEQAFSKLKAMLRKRAARSITQLHQAFRSILSSISPQECSAYFATAGYRT
jgi:transposase